MRLIVENKEITESQVRAPNPMFREASFVEACCLSWGSEKSAHFRVEQRRVERMTEEGLGVGVLR